MNKKVLKIKTLSSKRTARYEIRKEHIAYTDGTTEDRLACYDFTGKYLGGIHEAERVTSAPARTIIYPKVDRKQTK